MFKRILMPTDYSASADYAFGYAARLARDCGAQLIVLHVLPLQVPAVEPTATWPPNESTLQHERDRLAAHVRSRGNDSGLFQPELQLAWGNPFERILDAARTLATDLIVMGTHGRTGLKHLLLGSVTERIIRYAPCPVFAVRHPDHAPPLPGSPPPARAATAAPSVEAAVESIMHRNPTTIDQTESLAAAEALMTREGIHQLPVIEQGKLIGILAERDLHAHSGYYERTKVDAAMTANPVTVAPTESARRAAAILIDRGINALPVVDDERLVGMISRTDLLRLLVTLLDRGSS